MNGAFPTRRTGGRALVPGLLLLGGLAAAHADDVLPDFDPARIGWSSAHLEATKLFQSMTVTIDIEQTDATTVAERLLAPGEHELLAPPSPTAGLRFTTDGLGRRNEIGLLLDPVSGQILQRSSHETGKRNKYRIYRFGPTGAQRRTWRPAEGEEDAAPVDWSDRREQWFPVPAEVVGQTLTEPGTLIYLVTISDLAVPGDSFGLHAFSTSDETVYRIEAEVLSPDRVTFDYRRAGGPEDGRAKGKLDAIRVAIRGRPLTGDDDGELTLLGMRDVELLLDPTTRVPLELRGRVAVFGGVTFELQRLEHRE
jgi:hypothetical protein